MCLNLDKNITPSRSFSNIKGEKPWRIYPWGKKKKILRITLLDKNQKKYGRSWENLFCSKKPFLDK